MFHHRMTTMMMRVRRHHMMVGRINFVVGVSKGPSLVLIVLPLLLFGRIGSP